MRRRDFLKTGALAAALPFVDPFAAAGEVQELERRGRSQRIIVVGAGLAGLCAA
jgi:threonine dehydrogenase-like Zn-dependent dehydrogenase